jgi:uncharacterized glyoxalase superfamily protein PhnB
LREIAIKGVVMAVAGQVAFTPTIFYRDPMAALRWLEAAFGFDTCLLVTGDDGSVGHAEMSFGDGRIAVGGEWSSPELVGPAALKSPASLDGAGTQFVRVHLTGGLEAHCERARAAGARITQEPSDQFYGARGYRAVDPEGHVWTFDQPVRTLSFAEMEQASGLTFKSSL